MKLATDYPLLNIKYDFLDTIHVPNIKMCSPGYFEMLACDYKLNNNIEIPGCLRYISNITYNSGDQRYCRTFNSGLKYVREKPDGLNKLKFYFNINTTEAEAEELGVALITLDFISHNFNPLLKMDKAVELRLQLQGIFVPAIVDRVSLVKFRTKTYNSIPPWNFGSIFGLPPTYHTTSSIECLVNYFPFNQDPYNMPIGTNGYFSISPGDFIVEETSEKRTTTILSIFGSAGGAFGIVMNTLAFLFGSSRLDPWGFVRRISIDKWYFIRRQYDDIIVPYDKIDFKQYLNFYNGNMA
ncbi:hypothetical protein GLOIN_2v1482321 [Rhizophagus irregularis DAOM 181602=DAOM 197198]|uniref:Uncharacterized protein n=1 Tax=Rhizophagus irregularis (strain DAOM 181602 / DAOM 197198 / MUCL 43194) TaxID=747089 RepID=A0A2P4PM72_RHIID|nr:hypothetical protein GLOIN_2v1482321 [Rhizophagus irregularis DAOM 181602=DAOM 197198]POG66488.1 hypothetical protein GLOIN_2v1482321 [Rhizophagus irregularis DAOM 181602=DAOM 197198]|eukprot:XP_025173354.1 hypothetical protein GLOIN_2v1482321 [Rhizophagus irregularis DAOM 181602=DAOM 197198]